MKVGDKVYQVANEGTLIVESSISDIYTVNDITYYDTVYHDGTNGVTFDERAINTNIFLTEQAAQIKANKIQENL